MARGKSARASHDDLAETPAGMNHTADSLRNPPHGEFYESFGPPGDPTQTPKMTTDKRIGKAPSLLKKFQGNRKQS